MEKIIVKREQNGKVLGYIQEVENNPQTDIRYDGKYYALYKNGNLILTHRDYDTLHEMLYDDKLYKWEVAYYCGNPCGYNVRKKEVIANNSFDAIKKSRVKNIVELIKGEEVSV